MTNGLTALTPPQITQQDTDLTKKQLSSAATEEQEREALLPKITQIFAKGVSENAIPRTEAFDEQGITLFKQIHSCQALVETAIEFAESKGEQSKYIDAHLMPIATALYPHASIDFLEQDNPESFAQRCALLYPLVFPFFVQIFPNLKTLEQLKECDLAELEEGLTHFCTNFPKTQKACAKLLDRAEEVFSSSKEKERLFYRVFARSCSDKFFFYGPRPPFTALLEYFFARGKSNPLFALEVAKIAAAQDGAAVSQFIKHLGIDREEARIEIAEIAADQHARAVALFIQNFGIDREEARIKIAEIVAHQDGRGVSECFKNFGIKDEKARIKIARIAAAQNGEGVVRFIKHFGIQDKKELIEILKIAAAQNGLAVSEDIENFNIESEEVRIEIAKTAAAQNGAGVTQYIANFRIKSEETRIEIAKIAAGQNGWGVALCIKRFGIESEEALIEIAKIAATQDGGAVSEFFKHFDIKDEKARIEIAEIAAAQNGGGVAQYFKNFDIKDEKARIKIAGIAAAQNGLKVSEYFKNFGIESEEARVKIAEIAADQPGWGISQYIEEYTIASEEARIKIARIAAAHNGWRVAQYFKNFDIKDEKARIEIARISAAQDAWGLSKYIGNFGIENEGERIEIARIAAAQHGRGISEYIKNFRIESEEVRIEIAKIAAAQDGAGISQHIKNYEIKKQTALFSIFLIAYGQSSAAMLENLCKYNFSKDYFPDFFAACRSLQKDPLEPQKILSSLCLFNKGAESLGKGILAIKDPRGQKLVLIRLIYLLGCCALEGLSQEQFSSLQEKGLIEAYLHYRDPALFTALVAEMMIFAKTPVAEKYWLSMQGKHGFPQHALLPMLLLSSLFAQGSVCDNHLETSRKYFEKARQRPFREGKTLKVFVNFLNCIVKTKELDLDEKHKLLQYILEQKELEFINCMRAVIAISDLGEISQLKPDNLEKLGKTPLSKILETSFKKIIPLKPTPDFAEKFLKLFVEARVPNYILIYSAKIASIKGAEGERLKECLSTCVQSYLDGTFLKERYDLEKNIHLKTVFAGRPQLFEEWKRGEVSKLECFLPKDPIKEKKTDFTTILKQKILIDEHLNPDRLPFLKDCLENRLSHSDALEKIKVGIKSAKVDSEESHLLKLQHACIQLLDPKLSLSETKQTLKEMAEHIKGIPKNEFSNDIRALLNGLEARPQKKEDQLYIVDTDDFQDLCLCGTEVEGSCQRIDGDPFFNKCLMGYVIDGKNRLLAIKDKEGRILARGILRILWNGSEPVLFLERLYPATISDKFKNALEQFAKHRAKKLGLALLSQQVGRGEICSKPVSSLGSTAPFEYSDSTRGAGITEGVYQIQGAHFLYKPLNLY